MPREKESYRDNLERLIEHFPDREMLQATEVSKFFGLDVRTIRRRYFKAGERYISKATLARRMS